MQRFTGLLSRRLSPAVLTTSIQRASVHALNVPDYTVHSAVTPFQNGVPVEMVRDLNAFEGKWDFWTSSDVITSKDNFPGFLGYKYIPYGQAWVLEDGKVLQSGWNFIVPFVNKIKAIKNSHTITSGVLSEEVSAKNGKTVEAYAVVYFKVQDFKKSAFYVDPESNTPDSEKALSKYLRKVLTKEISQVNATDNGVLSEADAKTVSQNLLTALKSKEAAYGLTIESVELRGAFPTEMRVPEKILALEPPAKHPDTAGHGLSNDYWADVLTPPFFEKNKFGSRKEDKTPAAVNLIWSIPSPPDFHHFNHVPRVCVNPSETRVEKA